MENAETVKIYLVVVAIGWAIVEWVRWGNEWERSIWVLSGVSKGIYQRYWTIWGIRGILGIALPLGLFLLGGTFLHLDGPLAWSAIAMIAIWFQVIRVMWTRMEFDAPLIRNTPANHSDDAVSPNKLRAEGSRDSSAGVNQSVHSSWGWTLKFSCSTRSRTKHIIPFRIQ